MALSSWFRSAHRGNRDNSHGGVPATSRRFRPRLEILEARDVPSFLPAVDLAVDPVVVGSAVGDLNRDGRDDIVTISQPDSSGSRLFVNLSRADGGFTPSNPIGGYDIGTNASKPAVGDFNGDGNLDVIALNNGNSVRVLLGNGNGTFSTTFYATSVRQTYALTVADLNGDGKSDLVLGRGSGVDVLLARKGGGTSMFDAARSYSTSIYYTQAVAVADVNGDGKRDLVTLNSRGGNDIGAPDSVSVLLGNGDGTFATGVKTSYLYVNTEMGRATITYARALALGDFNGNGKLDLAVASDSGLYILPGNGDGTFRVADEGFGVSGDAVGVADFNRDRKLDLVVNNSDSDGPVSVLLGNGDGTFASPQVLDIGGYTPVVVGDFNGDHFADLVVRQHVLVNAADWGTQVVVRFLVTTSTSVKAGQPFSLTITAVDADGNVVSGYTGTIHFSSSDGTATLPADYTFTAADSGTVTFTGLVLRKKGNQKITITDTWESFLMATVSISVA